MSSCMPRWQECQEDFPGVVVQKMILHRRVAHAPVYTLPLLYTPCPCVVPIMVVMSTIRPPLRIVHGRRWHRQTARGMQC